MRLTKFALAAGLVAIGATGALAQSLRGESGLVGVKLYDTGVRLVSIYGSPDDIQAVTLGGGAVGPAGGGGGGAGRGAGPGTPTTAGGGGSASAPVGFDFTFGDDILRQGNKAGPGGGGPSFAGAPGAGGQEGALAGGGGSGGGGGVGSASRTIFTRWIYRRGGSRYGFVLDKFNKVVQIEAVGLSNPRVRTSTGIGFGASFATIIKTYGAPDGYELNGEHLMIRYLIRNKVAFRLSRLGQDKPHVVTGIVVAAGKA